MNHQLWRIFSAVVIILSFSLGVIAGGANIAFAQSNYPTYPSSPSIPQAQAQCPGPFTSIAPAATLLGAVISSIDANSPAAQAGLKEDEVILSLNGQPFAQDSTLDQALASLKPGSSITLSVSAAGEPPVNMPVTFEASSSNPNAPYLGVTTEMNPVEGGPFYGVNQSANCQGSAFEFPEAYEMGMMATDLTAGGPAATAGLMQGDLVLAINSQALGAPYDLTGFVQSAKPGSLLNLAVFRSNGQSLNIQVTLGADPQNANQAFLGANVAPIVEGPEANPESSEGQALTNPVYPTYPVYPAAPIYPQTPYYYGVPYYYGIPFYGGGGEEFWERFGVVAGCAMDGDGDQDDSAKVCGTNGNDVETLTCAKDGDHDIDDSYALCKTGNGNDVETLTCAKDGDHDIDDSSALCKTGNGNDVETLTCANDGDHDIDDSSALCKTGNGNDVETLTCVNDGDHDMDDSPFLCKPKDENNLQNNGNEGNNPPKIFILPTTVPNNNPVKPPKFFFIPPSNGNNDNNRRPFFNPTSNNNGTPCVPPGGDVGILRNGTCVPVGVPNNNANTNNFNFIPGKGQKP